MVGLVYLGIKKSDWSRKGQDWCRKLWSNPNAPPPFPDVFYWLFPNMKVARKNPTASRKRKKKHST